MALLASGRVPPPQTGAGQAAWVEHSPGRFALALLSIAQNRLTALLDQPSAAASRPSHGVASLPIARAGSHRRGRRAEINSFRNRQTVSNALSTVHYGERAAAPRPGPAAGLEPALVLRRLPEPRLGFRTCGNWPSGGPAWNPTKRRTEPARARVARR